MPIKKKTKWANVKVKEPLIKLVDDYLKTEKAARLGLTSKSAVVEEALRQLLRKEGVIE